MDDLSFVVYAPSPIEARNCRHKTART